MVNRLEQLQNMLQAEPEDDFLQYAIAMEYISMRTVEKAIPYLKHIVKQNPDYLACYYQLGKCAEELKQIEEAKTYYQLGIEIAEKQNKLKTRNELKQALLLLED